MDLKSMIFGTVSLFSVLACAGVEDSPTPCRQEQYVTLFSVTDDFTPLVETRTQVGDIAEDGALSIEWSVGDRIGVFGDRTANVPFTSMNTVPAERTSFRGVMEGDRPVYAYYPYSETVTDVHSIPVGIPSEQLYVDEGSIAGYDVKASYNLVAEDAGTYSLGFRQMTSLVRFEIDLTAVPYLGSDERLFEVEIRQTGTSVPMSGEFTYDLADPDAGLVPRAESQAGIKISFVNQPVIGEKIIAYAVVAPGRHKGNEWNCEFITDRHSVKFSTTVLCDLEAGKYYTVPLDVTVLSNNQAEYEDLPQTETEETANCYIVTETGEHKFLATVIGNGEAGILPEAGFHTSSAIINPRSAGLLWSDVDGFISDVRLEAGEVHYTVNSLSGNAVIAVYSGPDRTGVILWSWHIWGTGGEIPADEVITNRVGAKFTMMDRTLGAHSKTSICATLYQWGRKDPFPNTKTYFVDGEEVDILDEFPVYQSSGTLQEGIENPGCFIRFGTENDWLAERHDALWGDEYNATSYNDASAGQGWAYGKTIYDPCPAGYRVSGSYAWTGFVNTSSSLFATKDSNIEYVKFDNGYYFKRNESDTEGTFYPMVGSRGQYGGADGGINSQGNYLAGYNAGYWKSNPAREVSGAGRAYMMEIGKYTAPGNNNSNPANNVKASYIAERRYALGVRCERIPMNN